MHRQVRRLSAAALSLLAGSLCLATGPGSSVALAATPTHTSTSHPSEISLPLSSAGGVAIATRPVGLSLEYSTMAQDLGTGACPPAALITTLRQLGSPPLALAGESQDLTVPAEVLPSPPSWESATLYPLPATFWSQLHCLLIGAGDPLDAGLNLRKGVPSWAALMAAGAQSAATNGLEFSLGNEPDLYSLHNYASLTKALPNAEATAVGLYLQLATALAPTIGAAPLIGPELARPGSWRRSLPRIISQLHERTVGVHLYPLSACEGPSAVTIPRLLGSGAANAPRSLAWVVADARAAGVPAIISEANSASCGGRAGVSDTPAAAVWAVRFVLAAIETGFQEVRFHFSGGSYDPFLVSGASVIDRPLESALVALNQWLPVGASIRGITGVHGLTVTAINSAPGSPQLILDDESSKPQTVVLRGADSTAETELLSPTRTGLQTQQLVSSGGRITVTVPANSVLAVLGADGASVPTTQQGASAAPAT
ncbi:MAG TPA: hypothetical protein VGL57_04290 [Solirubrobacteraceae bacterium]|jgi:hypothetical protein